MSSIRCPCQKKMADVGWFQGKNEIAKKCTLIVLFVKNLKLRFFDDAAHCSARRKNPPIPGGHFL